MKTIVPYTKDIKFDSKIAEICSISLEHELNIQDEEITGNFIVSGEYRSHEVSVNKEPFNYKLPFSVDVTDNILKESIDFEITDFTYEVTSQDTLRVNIEFSITAMEAVTKENKREDVEKEIEELFDIKEDRIEEESIIDEEEKKEVVIEEPKIEPEINVEQVIEEKVDKEDDTIEERLESESEDLILSNANGKEDEFATYHIHIVAESDTLESICSMYQIDSNTLKDYNTILDIHVGDKIIIPCLDE